MAVNSTASTAPSRTRVVPAGRLLDERAGRLAEAPRRRARPGAPSRRRARASRRARRRARSGARVPGGPRWRRRASGSPMRPASSPASSGCQRVATSASGHADAEDALGVQLRHELERSSRDRGSPATPADAGLVEPRAEALVLPCWSSARSRRDRSAPGRPSGARRGRRSRRRAPRRRARPSRAPGCRARARCARASGSCVRGAKPV